MFLKYRHKFRLTIIYNTNAGQLFYSLELLQGYLILRHGTNFIICPMVRYTGNFWNLVAPTSGSGVRAPNVKTRLSQKRLGIRDKNVKQKCSAGGIPYKSKWAWRLRDIAKFAMTINKSQGQSLGKVAIYLPRPVFSHGQLYVGLSRARSFAGMRVYIEEDHGQEMLDNGDFTTRNK